MHAVKSDAASLIHSHHEGFCVPKFRPCLVGVNGEAFAAASQIAKMLLRSKPGEQLRLRVYRQGRSLEILVPLMKMQMQF
jgi:C-terminal processing protease CtpA/Prc